MPATHHDAQSLSPALGPVLNQPATLVYGMCFDGSVVRGQGDDGQLLHFSNTQATGHVTQLESHYAQARRMGVTRFRNTIL